MKQPTIQFAATDSLLAYAGNPRTHSKSQITQIANSLKTFGFINPIIVGADGVVLAGHGRLLAAKSLGLATVPVLRADHLTSPQRRAYALADNRSRSTPGGTKRCSRSSCNNS